MLSRGFRGVFHVQRQQVFGVPELLFVLGWSALFILLRLVNVSQYLGRMVTP
jgi:cobalt/nickel transport system permease protein